MACITFNSFVEPNKILLPSLYIKLEVMKNFLKTKDEEGRGFAFFKKFPRICMERLQAGIFDSSQTKELMKDTMFGEAQSKTELSAWKSLKSVVTNFQGNHRSTDYEKDTEEFVPT